jgi:hypothetical protein
MINKDNNYSMFYNLDKGFGSFLHPRKPFIAHESSLPTESRITLYFAFLLADFKIISTFEMSYEMTIQKHFKGTPSHVGCLFYAAAEAAFFVCGGLGGSAEFGFQRQRAGGKVRSPEGMTAFV